MTGQNSRAARVGYLLIILISTLANLHFSSDLSHVPARFARAVALEPHLSDVVDGARNVLLFAGFGALWIATGQAHRRESYLRVGLLGFSISFAIEAMQLFSPVREASLLDVVTDTIGTLIGAVVTRRLYDGLRDRIARPRPVGIPISLFALSYAGAALMEALIPLLRQAPSSWGPAGPGALLAMASGTLPVAKTVSFPITDLFIFLPVGLFTVAALIEDECSSRVAWRNASVLGVMLFAAAEIAHGAIRQPIDLGAFAIHATATALGATLAVRWLIPASKRVQERDRVIIVAFGYMMLIMVWAWRPFQPVSTFSAIAEQFSAAHFIAMRSVIDRSDLFTVTDVIAQGLLFVPLGALMAVWPLRKRGALRGLLPVIYCSIVLELGKSLVAGRYVDITHMLVQISGAGMGWLLVRHAGYSMRGELVAIPHRRHRRFSSSSTRRSP